MSFCWMSAVICAEQWCFWYPFCSLTPLHQKIAWDVSHTAANGLVIKLEGDVVESAAPGEPVIRNHGVVTRVPAAYVTVTGKLEGLQLANACARPELGPYLESTLLLFNLCLQLCLWFQILVYTFNLLVMQGLPGYAWSRPR